MPAGLPRLSVLQLNGDPRVLHSFPTRRSSDLSFCPGHAASLFAVRGCNYSNVRCVCRGAPEVSAEGARSEEHTSELQSHSDLVCRLLLEKKKPGPARNRGGTDRPERHLARGID